MKRSLIQHLNLLTLLILGVIIFTLNGCSKSDPVSPTDPGGSPGVSKSVTSTQADQIDFDGFSLIIREETVPRLANGSPGTVVFSLNTSTSAPTELPPLPSGYTVVGKFLNAGPESFNFNYTVRMAFDASSQTGPTALKVLGYIPEENAWKIIPSYVLDAQNKKMGADVLKLGWFVLVKSAEADNSAVPSGGFQYCSNNGLDFIIVTIRSATFSDPSVSASYAAGLIGATFVSPNLPASPFPSDYCRGILPLGTYEVWVSSRNFASTEIYTYSVPYTFTISSSLNWPLGWIYTAGDGWTIFGCQAPAGGSWVLGRPQNWPQPTTPYGSGVLQTTLTWNNSQGSVADMDLHLYGPNGIHVYYNNRVTNDFTLDRDWTSTIGNATENIYSLNSTMPSGAYTIKAVHYSGDTKNFSVRTILNGVSTNFTGSLAGSQTEVTVKTFNIP